MTCVNLGLVPWTTNTTPGGFDEQRFQKGGLKGSLVVVVEAALRRGPRETRRYRKEALATLTHGHGVDSLCRRRCCVVVPEMTPEN